ncbi:MAG: RloB domain-containing protein [Firmicutes bacterium]|nr:RloB domain-containing protein [Bacillota bacterium]
MRERRNHSVRTAALQPKEPRKKYFLVYEGVETEPIYFEALVKCKEYSRINPLIDMVPIIRGVSKEGWSNPYKLMKGFLADLQACDEGTVTYNTLIDCIVDEARPGHVSKNSLYKSLKAIFTGSIGVTSLEDPVPVDRIKDICNKIESETELTKLVDTIPQIIKEYAITYQAGLDKICFVIDRDKHSFVKNERIDQYGYVLSKCKENNFGFYLTNPCFEYWLLLHFEETSLLDKIALLENQKINASGVPSRNGKTFTERELNKVLPGFKKDNYDAESLMPRIDIAIRQEESLCESPEELEYSLGSRVGLLIKELRG